MLTCVLCNENWVFMHSLCEECKKIRQLGNLYGMEKIHTILTTVLLRQSEKIESRTAVSKTQQEKIDPVKTRSQKKE
tara:strand:+ start:1590 stop:1820 length:231 start_codon:yes stop_codon:yes gene_type:complete